MGCSMNRVLHALSTSLMLMQIYRKLHIILDFLKSDNVTGGSQEVQSELLLSESAYSQGMVTYLDLL